MLVLVFFEPRNGARLQLEVAHLDAGSGLVRRILAAPDDRVPLYSSGGSGPVALDLDAVPAAAAHARDALLLRFVHRCGISHRTHRTLPACLDPGFSRPNLTP